MKLSTLSPLALAVGTALLLAACGEQAAKPAEAPAASGAAPAAGGEVQVSVNDKVCEPMELTVPAGKTTFVIKNNSMKALEWEILKGVMIVDERENIAPSLTQKLTVTLQPGEYEITCGLLSNPRGKLIVTENAGFKADAKTTEIAALAEPLGAYKSYVQEEMKQFVAKTEAFTAAVKSGDAEKAKSLYADTRTHYERIEPIAELFAELDSSIDARADAFETLEKDPNFSGFHRLEYALWSQKNIKDMGATADKLLADVKLLQTESTIWASHQVKWWAAQRLWLKKWPQAKSLVKKSVTATPICLTSMPIWKALRKLWICSAHKSKPKTLIC